MTQARIAIAAVLLWSSAALAQKEAKSAAPAGAAPAMEMPKPPPELAALKPLAGSWSCDGKMSGGSQPEQTYKANFTNKWELNNFWLWSVYQMKSKKMPMTFVGKGWMGYDSSKKKLVWAGVENTGGWISLTSSGWEGDTMIFTGDMMSQQGKIPASFVFTKGATPSEITLTVSGTGEKAQTVPSAVETCKKAGRS